MERTNNVGPSISVSIVTYSPNFGMLRKTLSSLSAALRYARSRRILGKSAVWMIDNGPGTIWKAQLEKLLEDELVGTGTAAGVISGHGNIGYGRGNNLTIQRCIEDYHLVLNPDVVLQEDAIFEALTFMETHSDVGMLTPSVVGVHGEREYLCKRFPSVLDLLLRGFAPAAVKHLFRVRLEKYEMREETGDKTIFDVPIASGSFMFARQTVLAQVGGFADVFFMYFEDFDLSIRVGRVSRIAYVPAVKITHFGGKAARKGLEHIVMFVRSGFIFFTRHGWKYW
jgi:GT2 family glycosyltransferase